MSTCEVSLNVNSCEAPPAIRSAGGQSDGYGSIRTRCYSCGASACKECSAIQIKYGKRVRICNDCVGEYQQ